MSEDLKNVIFSEKKAPAAAGKTSTELIHVIKSQERQFCRKNRPRQPGRPQQSWPPPPKTERSNDLSTCPIMKKKSNEDFPRDPPPPPSFKMFYPMSIKNDLWCTESHADHSIGCLGDTLGAQRDARKSL